MKGIYILVNIMISTRWLKNAVSMIGGLFYGRQSAEVIEDSKQPVVAVPPGLGQRVVVHNYHVGQFLESWNGVTGVVLESRSENTYIQLDGYPESVSALGFPHENLLVLKGDLADLPLFVTPGKQTFTICGRQLPG